MTKLPPDSPAAYSMDGDFHIVSVHPAAAVSGVLCALCASFACLTVIALLMAVGPVSFDTSSASAPQDVIRSSIVMAPRETDLLLSDVPTVSPPPSGVTVAVRMEQFGSSASSQPAMSTLEERRDARIEKLRELASHPAAPEAPVAPIIRSDNKVGVFLTAASVRRTDFLSDTMEKVKKSGGNALVFDVKGGTVLFHSAAPLPTDLKLVKSIYDLPAVLAEAKNLGLYTIGRFVAIKDAGLSGKKPATRVHDPVSGKEITTDWVDPGDPYVIDYNMQVVCELASMGIDEINFDYIRFPTENPRALAVFSGDQKADHLEKFISAARDTVNRCGPKTKLGLSTFAILGWNYPVNMETLGQDFVRFAPLVDVISPMAYPASFAQGFYYRPGKDPGSRMYFLVRHTIEGYQKLLGPDQAGKIRPWIQGYSVTSGDVADEIRAVYDTGLCGFTVWNAGNNYGVTYDAMTRSMAMRPDKCRE